ncbi:hypothetical protein HY469_03270 [Candidatus Roizmanbacteria bacterium]|nr:hypothetical protein [Candidatus Roizmanbacteria bacterium]
MSSRELCPFDPRTQEYQISNGLPVLCTKKRPVELMALSESAIAGRPISKKHIDESICQNSTRATRLSKCPAYWDLTEYGGKSRYAMRIVTQEELNPIEEFGRFRRIIEHITGNESCGDTSAVFTLHKETTKVTNGFVWGKRGSVTDTFGTAVSLIGEGIKFTATREDCSSEKDVVFEWQFVDKSKKPVMYEDEGMHERVGETIRGLLDDREWYVATGEAGVCISHFNHNDLLFFHIDPRQKHTGGEVLLFAEDVPSLSEALQG